MTKCTSTSRTSGTTEESAQDGALGHLGDAPGFSKIQAQLNVDDIEASFFKKAEAIESMTAWERRHTTEMAAPSGCEGSGTARPR